MRCHDKDDLFRLIAETYKSTKSLRQTSSAAKISDCAARKMLISMGLYSSPRADEIARLRSEGLTADEIAEKLGVSAKYVKSFLPYSRGSYMFPSQTENAERIREWRKRVK